MRRSSMFSQAWLALLLVAASLCGARAAEAVEVWTPETGEVDLEELPRQSVEERRRHALGLIGAGQWAGGVAELRALIQANPEAEWTEEARWTVARALIAGGHYREAFDELEALAGADPEGADAIRARDMQLEAARRAAPTQIGLALGLYDRLAAAAADAEEAALIQKERADALFAAGRFLTAEDEYLALIDFYPRSEWVPYCWYKIAECEWRLATWLDLGVERVEEAEQLFADYIDEYPGHEQTEEAWEKLEQVRRTEAELYARIAIFYIHVEKKPWAAVNYLQHIQEEFPGTLQADWAALERERIMKDSDAPIRGTVRDVYLPGVRRSPRGE